MACRRFLSRCSKLASGAVAIARAVLGRDAAEESAVQARRDICRTCDQASRNLSPRYAAAGGLTTLSRCRRCGCLIAAKTLLAGQRCPLGRW